MPPLQPLSPKKARRSSSTIGAAKQPPNSWRRSWGDRAIALQADVQDADAVAQMVKQAEAADAVLFFASPWARAVTGQNLIVDGGLLFG